jgi:hypothetical protein
MLQNGIQPDRDHHMPRLYHALSTSDPKAKKKSRRSHPRPAAAFDVCSSTKQLRKAGSAWLTIINQYATDVGPRQRPNLAL